MTDFALRSMEPTDGPALDALLREQAQTTTVAMTTHYRHDVYQALLAQHPSLYGVVAEAPGVAGLVGMATAFIEDGTIGGRPYPIAFLENLKVRQDVRRKGLGGRLAAWRIAEAERRFGTDIAVMAGIESSNEASIATARRWATQVVGPVALRITGTTGRAPRANGLSARPLAQGDVDAVLDGIRTFHAGHDLVPVMSPERLAQMLAPTALGLPIRQYRVAVEPGGTVVAGAGVSERFQVMVDRINRIPLPLAVVGRLTGMLPADRTIRSIELFLAWHAPGRVDAARHLWDAIRHEWRGRATNVVGQTDPRSTLVEAYHVSRLPGPRVEIMVAVRSPTPIGDDRLIYLAR